jgi:Schitoviridae RNA polymerase
MEREEVVRKHREWIVTQPELCRQAPIELKDKKLGCFCKPKPCHGDTLAELADNNGRLANSV